MRIHETSDAVTMSTKRCAFPHLLSLSPGNCYEGHPMSPYYEPCPWDLERVGILQNETLMTSFWYG